MAVTVRMPTVLRQYCEGKSSIEVPGNKTVKEVLEELSRLYPDLKGQLFDEEGNLRRFLNVYLNDDDIRYLENLETKVGDSDLMSILPAVAGGN